MKHYIYYRVTKPDYSENSYELHAGIFGNSILQLK